MNPSDWELLARFGPWALVLAGAGLLFWRVLSLIVQVVENNTRAVTTLCERSSNTEALVRTSTEQLQHVETKLDAVKESAARIEGWVAPKVSGPPGQQR